MFGRKRGELVGRTFREVFPAAPWEYWVPALGNVALTGKPARLEQYGRDTGRYYEAIAYAPRTGQFAAIFTDVTDRRAAEERMRHAQKMESIGLLAGGVAHDFNNLLTVIMGNASSALAQCPSCEHSQAILSASKRAAYLTKQLLAYAGKGQFVTKTFLLTDLVSRSRDLLTASVPKRVSLKFNLSWELPLIEDDPSRIEQILMNLVINAGEAIPPKTDGRIEITTGTFIVTPEISSQHSPAFEVQTGPHVFLEVRDNGTGMDTITASRIFDPFFSTKFTGRGLGLAAVYGIVRSSKGFIDVRSSPGRGSTFRVFLPGCQEKRPAEVSTERPGTAHRQELRGSATVLVVEDEEMVRSLACMALRGHGYDVLEAEDGQDALQVLAGAVSLPAIVLLDLAMPVMGGDELVPILEQRYPDLKIIVSSGYPEEEARKSFAAGAVVGFLQKPYTVVTLLEKIREIIPDSGPAPDSRIVEFPKAG
jgi:signal transduction histidine kinase/ActR/RegA family two-component response regulator